MDKLCAHDNCFHSAIKGFTHGLSYGAKVRFTHSLVMAILFSSEAPLQKLWRIFKNTKEHSTKLACYVILYKSLTCIIAKLTQTKRSLNHAIAGTLAGYVWFEDTSVNAQIAFYLLSRNLIATVKYLYRTNQIQVSDWLVNHSFTILNTLSWGFSLYLFELDSSVLQNSLTSSLVYLYKDSDKWNGWRHCVPYLDFLLKLISK
jgi:peroxisomal membrane protein 4